MMMMMVWMWMCEPAQSKCTWSRRKSHFVWKFTGKIPDANPATPALCEPAQSKCTWTCQKRHFVQKFTGKMPDPYPAASILCEPAPSKCTWTCHKRHFVRKFTRKMPDASETTLIEHQALTVTARTPQCGHAVWGMRRMWTDNHGGWLTCHGKKMTLANQAAWYPWICSLLFCDPKREWMDTGWRHCNNCNR